MAGSRGVRIACAIDARDGDVSDAAMTTASTPHTIMRQFDRYELVAAHRRRSRRWRTIIRASHAARRHVAARFGTRSSIETAFIFSRFFWEIKWSVHASLLALSNSPIAPIRQCHRPEPGRVCFADSLRRSSPKRFLVFVLSNSLLSCFP